MAVIDRKISSECAPGAHGFNSFIPRSFSTVARIIEILERINDKAATLVDLPGKNGENYRCKAVLLKKDAPVVELVFPPDSWEESSLMLGANCQLAVEHEDRTITLIACLDTVSGHRRLQFTAREPVSPESLREYFRVLINVPIEASYIAGPREVKAKTWKMIGTTIDLSGSGVLAVFAEKPPTTHNIQLVLSLPGEETPIVCLADVVRTYRLRKNRFQVAFHFGVVSSKTRDQIISCCLQEPRRPLRANVLTE
jgi:c-di-GMP-binding flagellar brake protein YcgR